ncbi:hypothetical protein AYI69_g6710 [Smittium culicis]|uniref:Uncharacterized protein n=1 Tax=Smittium culicis TaxID=133412 RepID=A0A1R1XX39_9FUNG|nr:hypothetical protein AYI69_g6710 [Smittium culicis]
MSNPGKKPNSADEWGSLIRGQQQLIDLQKAVGRGAPRFPPTTPHEKKVWKMIDTVTKSLKELSSKKRLDPFFKALMTQKARNYTYATNSRENSQDK